VQSNPSKPPPSILLYDPGAISSPSRASTYVPAPLRFVNWTLSLLAPLARLLGTQSLMEDVEVPAHALCGLACGEEFGGGRTGTWFLGDELGGRGEEVGEKEAREVWERTMGIVGGEEPAFGA
jgi:hypothetical protein